LKKLDFGVILILVCSALSGLAVSGLLTTSKTLSSTGSVKAINVEVYWDSQCTQSVTLVGWGTHEPGDSINRTIYIKNAGNAPMTLALTSSGWDPAEAVNHITLSWDKEGEVLDANVVAQAVLSLDISETVTGITDFSFNIVIEGSG